MKSDKSDAEESKQNNAEKDKLNSPRKKSIYDLEKQQQQKKENRIFPLSGVCACVGGKTLKFSSAFRPRKKRNKTRTDEKFSPVLNEPKFLCEKFRFPLRRGSAK